MNRAESIAGYVSRDRAKNKKRSVMIAGKKTSVGLEEPFWDGLKVMAKARGITVGALVAEIGADGHTQNLCSAIRMHVLAHYQAVRT